MTESEVFVDASCRGLDVGGRLKLGDLGPETGFLEINRPLPVGAELDVRTDEGHELRVVVIRVHEQVAGAEMPPGMRVRVLRAGEEAKAWWAERVARKEPQIPAPPPPPKATPLSEEIVGVPAEAREGEDAGAGEARGAEASGVGAESGGAAEASGEGAEASGGAAESGEGAGASGGAAESGEGAEERDAERIAAAPDAERGGGADGAAPSDSDESPGADRGDGAGGEGGDEASAGEIRADDAGAQTGRNKDAAESEAEPAEERAHGGNGTRKRRKRRKRR